MDEQKREASAPNSPDVAELRRLVSSAIHEYIEQQQQRAEPAYKRELLEERKRREQLESRVNDLVEENRKSRIMAEEAERANAVRSELQRLGVAKIDLAYKAVKEDVYRAEDGRLAARTAEGEVPVREYLAKFVGENPELLPARIPGGAGATGSAKVPVSSGFDLDKIKPGMSQEEIQRAREEISRIAMQSVRNI
jgi:hypothetical protein